MNFQTHLTLLISAFVGTAAAQTPIDMWSFVQTDPQISSGSRPACGYSLFAASELNTLRIQMEIVRYAWGVFGVMNFESGVKTGPSSRTFALEVITSARLKWGRTETHLVGGKMVNGVYVNSVDPRVLSIYLEIVEKGLPFTLQMQTDGQPNEVVFNVPGKAPSAGAIAGVRECLREMHATNAEANEPHSTPSSSPSRPNE